MSYSYFIFTMIYILFFTMIYILLASLAQGACHDRWRYGGREVRREGSQVDQGSMHSATSYWYNLRNYWESNYNC